MCEIIISIFMIFPQEVPPLIAAYCKTGDDLELVSRHRILVSTCSSAGMMFALGLKLGHFTHVFIDEVRTSHIFPVFQCSTFSCHSQILFNFNTVIL